MYLMNVINILFYVSRMSIFFFLSILIFLLYSTFANRLITPFTSTVIKTSSFMKYFTELINLNWTFRFQSSLLLQKFTDYGDKIT